MRDLIENQQKVSKWVRKQGGRLDIAVAFWGLGAAEELGLTTTRDVRVLLDLSAGASNPKEVQTLLELRPEHVRAVHRLHAKTYISDAGVIVGSANASADGLSMLGTEMTRWHELAMLADDATSVRMAREWFERLWASSEFITPAMIKAAKAAWKERQSNRAFASRPGQFILDAALANPADFADREIYVVITTQGLSAKGKVAWARLKEKSGHEVYVWERWPSIPLNAKLISFTDYAGDGLEIDDPPVYRSQETPPRGLLAVVEPTKITNFKIGSIERWRDAVNWAKSTKDWKGKDGYCQRLDRFVAGYSKLHEKHLKAP
ncbi:MAG: phospholipase D family protein [Devosia sp.]